MRKKRPSHELRYVRCAAPLHVCVGAVGLLVDILVACGSCRASCVPADRVSSAALTGLQTWRFRYLTCDGRCLLFVNCKMLNANTLRCDANRCECRCGAPCSMPSIIITCITKLAYRGTPFVQNTVTPVCTSGKI